MRLQRRKPRSTGIKHMYGGKTVTFVTWDLRNCASREGGSRVGGEGAGSGLTSLCLQRVKNPFCRDVNIPSEALAKHRCIDDLSSLLPIVWNRNNQRLILPRGELHSINKLSLERLVAIMALEKIPIKRIARYGTRCRSLRTREIVKPHSHQSLNMFKSCLFKHS